MKFVIVPILFLALITNGLSQYYSAYSGYPAHGQAYYRNNPVNQANPIYQYTPVNQANPTYQNNQVLKTASVQTDSGLIVGLYLSTVLKKVPYFSFKGIPYAEPPVGNLRFKPPKPKSQWNGILYAFNDKERCLQVDHNELHGSEDCLYLNVYTPDTNTYKDNNINGKPVIVWIHGGAFTTGNGNSSYYGPDFLLEEDVVVVSVQYRLGPLGFLNINHPDASGNYGLKDQNLALKWVQRNIAAFGGDPNRVTLFGQSAGGVSVDLHKLSDMSVGLFKQTISMSASPLCKYWAFQSHVEAEKQAYLLGAKFGVKRGDADGLVKTLLQADAKEIIKKANEMLMIPFRPTLESSDVAPEQIKFLTECTPKKYQEGNYTKGPQLMGFTSTEILSMAGTFDDLIKWHKDAAESVRNYDYIKLLPVLPEFLAVKFNAIASLKQKAFANLIEQLSDIYFVTGIDMKQRLLAATNQDPIYYYRFDFKAPESAHRSEGVVMLEGVAHEDELPYLFYRPHLNIPLHDSKIADMRNKLVKMWTNFARFGTPTPTQDNLLGNITWPNSGSDGIHLEITNKLEVKSRPTNVLIKLYQKFGFGDSKIYNDCDPTVLSNIINGIANIPGTAKEIIEDAIGYFDKFKNTIDGVVNKVEDVVAGAKDTVVDVEKKVVDEAGKTIKDVEDKVLDTAKKTKDGVVGVTNKVVDKAGKAYKDVEGNVVDTAKKTKDVVVDVEKKVVDKAGKAIKDVEDKVLDTAKKTKEGVMGVKNEVVDKAGKAIKGVEDTVGKLIPW